MLYRSDLLSGISIHSLRVEGDSRGLNSPINGLISIHSLRVEGDVFFSIRFGVDVHFNPLPPCGGRPFTSIVIYLLNIFQSTPSVWRETI